MILLYSTDNGHVPPWEYLQVSQAKVGVGMAWSGGELVPSADPTYICMSDAPEANGLTPCVEINETQVWSIDSDVDFVIGVTMDLSDDGERLVGLGKTFYPVGSDGGKIHGRFTMGAAGPDIPIAVVGTAIVGKSKTGGKV